ncbi:MAG TPA: hypothetical protein VJX69_00865 [Terriglobales bacterium]|nr:hypothetical protein [Terriglobales bacterium]
MHRCGSGFLLTLAIIFVIAFTGCLGKSSSNPGNGGVTSITLSPSSRISMDVGGTQVFSASAKDASGRTVLGVDIQFIVESGNPNGAAPISISSNGAACAGTWDVTATICSPGTPGTAYVRAVASGASSAQTTVYVHQHIDSIQITRLPPSGPPQTQYDCFPQGQTWLFGANAYSDIAGNNVDITDTVGPMNWSARNAVVTTFSTNTTIPSLQPNQVQTTAKTPGITELFASVSGAGGTVTTSSPYLYTTCLIQAIHLQIGGQAQGGNSITLNNGGGVSITATAVDTLYNEAIADNAGLTSPPLTWSTTNPEVIAFTNTTSTSGTNSATARANLGGGIITASCTPPTCNVGVLPALPVYASDGMLPNGSMGYGAISVDVTSTSKPPTYTAWVSTTDCQDAPGCSSAMFSVTPGATPIGTVISLPRTPNSMVFNHQSSARVYLGTSQGLMYVDVTSANPSATEVSSLSTPCNVSLCGKVLTISNDGKLVVVSDTVSTPNQVYIYNTASAPVDLIIPGETATAAAFSPDQLELFILTSTGRMYVYSTVNTLTSLPIATSVTSVAFSGDGSFAYVAGTPTAASISGFATCNPQLPQSNLGFVTTPGTPIQLFPSPDGQHVIAIDPPNIDIFTTSDTQNDLLDGQFACNAPTVTFPNTVQQFNLGQGAFTPIYSQLANDGAEVIVVAQNIPAVLLVDVSNGTTTSVQLVGDSYPLAASASTDGSQVYVAACDQYTQINPPPAPPTCAAGSVHIVNTCAALACNIPPTLGQGDFQQVPFVNVNNSSANMCNNQGTSAPVCLPNLVAIRPQ